jgi:hypothetical protein
MRFRFILGLALVFALGCGGKKFAPVSGVVTMNGKPLAGATVTFMPVLQGGGIESGPSSDGKTNEKGEYTLTAATGQKGALVGKHKVVISILAEQVGEGDERAPRGGWPKMDKIPAKYNDKTELECIVPAEGKQDANFDLKPK